MPQREEESLIDEMRQTIRADRERAATRSTPSPIQPIAVDPAATEPEQEHEPAKGLVRRLLGR